VFIFRFEPREALPWSRQLVEGTPEGKMPVIYLSPQPRQPQELDVRFEGLPQQHRQSIEMLTSYAQNFEDVMLWRALKQVKKGQYIDIGAQDPVVDSVSLMFYEHGWRGIHVEPTMYYADQLRKSRPDETIIQAAVGAISGEINFYEIPNTGLSTADPKIAARHKSSAEDFEVREVTVACVTLKDIFSLCPDSDIHWLKIDVEGFEKQVLKGWQDSPLLPWIVVIESTQPLTQVASHHEWEPLILGREYQFAYSDGLNRFYISKHHQELLNSFTNGPNLFDDFALSGMSNAPFCKIVNARVRALDERIQKLNADLLKAEGLTNQCSPNDVGLVHHGQHADKSTLSIPAIPPQAKRLIRHTNMRNMPKQEEKIILEIFDHILPNDIPQTIVDVGGNKEAEVSEPFVKAGWRALIIEPQQFCFQLLNQKYRSRSNVRESLNK
jgi:FkbM family methyltransferase